MLWIPVLMLALQTAPNEGMRSVQQGSSALAQTQTASHTIVNRSAKATSAAAITVGVTGETPRYQQAAADDNAFWSHLGISSWISMGITAALLLYGIVYRIFFAHGYAGSGRRRHPSRV